MTKIVTQEMFMRYDKPRQVFEFKLTEETPPVDISEAAVPQMLSTAPPKQAELLRFLVDEARKADGKWVSASTAPLKEGQATIGR